MFCFCDTNEQNKQKMWAQVVPVFGTIKNKKQAIATAIVLNSNFIITVAHTFYRKNGTLKDEEFEIYVNSEKHLLQDPIYKKYSWNYTEIKDDIYHDLCIFNMPDKLYVNSELYLYDDLDFEGHLLLKGYPYSNCEPETTRTIIHNKYSSSRTYKKKPLIRLNFTNCFQLEAFLIPGFSGGPVLNKNEVLGMIVYGPEPYESNSSCTAIKAEYIMKVIKENGWINK